MKLNLQSLCDAFFIGNGITSISNVWELKNLKKLNITDCEEIEASEGLIAKLVEMEFAGCIVEYPLHIIIDQSRLTSYAKNKLKTTIDDYQRNQSNQPISKNSIEQLFHRYLTEGFAVRAHGINPLEKASNIAKSTFRFLDFIKEKPQTLTLISNICQYYLSGCVNQPVAGFCEINALIEMENNESIKDKILGAKYLITLTKIKEILRENSPGASYEAEASNAMLISIHQKLIEHNKISQPWLAVPEKILYEDSIFSWLRSTKTKDAIKRICDQFSNLDLKECTKFILNKQMTDDSWQIIAFHENEEINKIKHKYSDDLEKIDDSSSDYSRLCKELETARHKEINDKIIELTYEAIHQNLSEKDAKEIFGDELIRKKIAEERDKPSKSAKKPRIAKTIKKR